MPGTGAKTCGARQCQTAITVAGAVSSRSDRGDGGDFDLQVGDGELGDFDDDAARPVLGEVFHPDVGDVMKGPHVGDVNRDLYDVLHVRFIGDEDGPDVLQ